MLKVLFLLCSIRAKKHLSLLCSSHSHKFAVLIPINYNEGNILTNRLYAFLYNNGYVLSTKMCLAIIKNRILLCKVEKDRKFYKEFPLTSENNGLTSPFEVLHKLLSKNYMKSFIFLKHISSFKTICRKQLF